MEQPVTGSEPAAAPDDATSLDPVVRARISRRQMVMGVGLLVTSGLTFARTPKRQFPQIEAAKYEALFPRQFGDWNALPTADLILPPESDLANKLYEHILTRAYKNSQGRLVMFLVAYSSVQIDDVQVHRPEVCYAVSGFTIQSNQPYDLRLSDKLIVPSRLVLARSTLRSETVLYWTRVGSIFPESWSGQRTAMLLSNLEGYYPDGLLVRASVITRDKSDVDTLAQFYRDLAAYTSPQARRLLFNT